MGTNREPLLHRYYTTLIVLGLIAFNAVLVLPLFQGGYTPYMGSIESAFLTDGRFIAENFPHVSWNPLWYMGFPFHLFYTPALPYMVAGLHSVSGISIASAYRLLTGMLYVCAPATLFVFVHYMTRRRYPAATAALIYSLAPSFCYLIPGVRSDAASFGYSPWSLIVLLRYGEGPHISALAFTPLAALCLMHAMRRPSLRNSLLAALSITTVALINFIALFALAIILIVVFLSEALVGQVTKKLTAALTSTLLAYGVCAFWFNSSFIQASLTFGGLADGGILSSLLNNWLALILLLVVTGTAAVVLFGGRTGRQPVLVIGGWFLAFAIIVFASHELGITLAPQPNRYMPELNMAAAMALGVAADWTRTRLWHMKVKWARMSSRAVASAVLILVVLVSVPFLGVAHAVTQPTADITATSEYQVSQWLASHVKDERVYATGSHAFWLNVFTDVPQIRGGTDQGATNLWWSHVSYQINTGQNGTITTLWARALGIRYIVVSYPGSADAFQDYAYPAKLEGLLPKVYDNRGIAIFEAPPKRPGLIQVLDLSAYDKLTPIRDAVDINHLSQYVELVELSPAVIDYNFVSNDRLEFDADLATPNQAILVRMTYDRGWQAYCNDQPVPIRKDLVDFLLVYPQRQGHCHFVMQHVPLWDEWIGYGLTALTMMAIVLISVRHRLHDARASKRQGRSRT